ncbi:HTH-type transcriptional activator RhaR [Paenibacillus allorhizoplanae]|uniref:HTH-type transcriptional activator RhaR n=1 Tax=Paenibacillus allorhizoplanae TaxID=2905648 RepID=A0ABM9BSX9_9BACL|nr:helix-turn-helix domain-containing protein [Paenibacillus allorhizoplanae]CAH1192628.1 HTH-type transcriptional activator RhaR [Paenibacillus allorhizoplanae]
MTNITPYWEANKDQSHSGNLERPFYIGSLKTTTEGYRIGHHWHYHMEVVYWAEGSGTVTTGSSTFNVQDGDLVIIPPCEVHAVHIEANLSTLHYVIGFDTELMSPMPQLAFDLTYRLPFAINRAPNWNLLKLSKDQHQRLEGMITNMYNEFTTKEIGFELTVTSGIHQLMLFLLRDSSLLTHTAPEGVSHGAERMQAFSQVFSFINDHSHEELNAVDVARVAMMSYSRFATVFKQFMHMPLVKYITFLRIRKAEQLLLDPSKSITQIATETGFNHTSYFIKHFRILKGISPFQYRKRLLGL